MATARSIVRVGVQSAVIHVLADGLGQTLEHTRVPHATDAVARRGGDWEWDTARTARFAVVGAVCHGPYFGIGFSWLDRVLGPSRALGNVARKVVATQLVLNPPYLVLLFGALSVLERRRWGWRDDEVGDNTLSKAAAALGPNFAFWPVANTINFLFVGPRFRVAYVAACGGCWNTFISLLNSGSL